MDSHPLRQERLTAMTESHAPGIPVSLYFSVPYGQAPQSPRAGRALEVQEGTTGEKEVNPTELIGNQQQ
jgi:hypothetical protein